jgi:GTP-binding protein HflX
LPPNLIDAFSSTLEDSIESDLLLHVIDASDPKIAEKIQVVDDILQGIGAVQKKLYIFNKSDMISDEQKAEMRLNFSEFNPIFVSAFSKI